jgi:hypothetical protein
MTAISKVLFDFTDPHAATAWRAIDDRVMGGVSRSALRLSPSDEYSPFPPVEYSPV